MNNNSGTIIVVPLISLNSPFCYGRDSCRVILESCPTQKWLDVINFYMNLLLLLFYYLFNITTATNFIIY